MRGSDGMGTVQRDGERCTVEFRRVLPAAAGDVWAALTEPARLGRWFGAQARVTPGPGGLVELRWDDADQWVRGAILTWEPPRVLEYEWRFPGEEESVVRFELAPAGDGTALVLTHRRLGPAGTGYGPAWHAYLDRLAGLYAGADVSWQARFAEVRPRYAAAQ